ncbi:MAG: hypothetical protein ACOC16_00975 [Nanoarchaeota archaeon]
MDKAQEYYKKTKAYKRIKKEINFYSLWSFIISLFLLFNIIFLFPLIQYLIYTIFLTLITILSITLGVIAIINIKNNKNKDWGIGFAITSILISIFILFILFTIKLNLYQYF